MEIEFPGRYAIHEARFPAISDRIRSGEVEQDEPIAPLP